MYVKMILDVSNLTVPLEKFLEELVDEGFVIGEHEEEKNLITIYRPVSLKQFFKINFHMVKNWFKEKITIIKSKLVDSFNVIVNRIKRKLYIIKGKLTTGLKRRIKRQVPKIKGFFTKIKNTILRRSDDSVMSEHDELPETSTEG